MTYSREGKARARACQSDNTLSWVKLTQAEKQLVDPNSIRNRHGLVLLCAPWTAFLTFTTSILPPHTSLCFFGDASKEVWRRQLVPHPICLLKGSTWKWFPKLVSHSAHWYVGKNKNTHTQNCFYNIYFSDSSIKMCRYRSYTKLPVLCNTIPGTSYCIPSPEIFFVRCSSSVFHLSVLLCNF